MTTPTHRLFFALWPDKKVRADIKKHVQSRLLKYPAKKVPMPNWHITLAFLGNVSAATKACVVAEASLVKGQSFGLKLDELGFFKRASIVWLGTKQCPDALIQLVQQLNVRLASCGYQPGFKTYTPHLTLLRKADKSFDLKGVTPIEWSVHDFVLVESVTTNRGATYEVMHRWDLAS